MKNKNLISISGRIGAGKDLAGKIMQYLIARDNNWEDRIKEQYAVGDDYKFTFEDFVEKAWSEEMLSGYKIKKFASNLKDISCLLLGCSRADLEDRDFKDSVLGEEWWYFDSISGKIPYRDTLDTNVPLIKPTVRQFLQQLGTNALRNVIHENVHVNALFGTYNAEKMDQRSPSRWIITDTRFPNELQAIKDRNGIIIRIDRPSKMSWMDVHESEITLLNSRFDYEINNNGSIDDLIVKIKNVLAKEGVIRN